MKKKILIAPITAITTAGIAMASMASCSCSNTIKVEQISFSQEYSYVDVGAKRDFNNQVKILPENASDKSVTWSIKDEKSKEVASVDANTGILTGLKTGYAHLTCTCKSDTTKSTTQTVIVGEYIALNDFNISCPKQKVILGDKFTMDTTFEPETATAAKYAKEGWVEWTSSKPEVAYVEGNGNITALAEGTTTLTATPYDYNPNTRTIELKESLRKTFDLTVQYAQAESIVVSPSSIEIQKGTAIYVGTKILPAGARQDIQLLEVSPKGIVDTDFSSSTKICTVRALALGTATLTFNSSSYPDVKGVCTITVSEQVTPVESIEFKTTTKEVPYGSSWTVNSDNVNILPKDATIKGYSISSSNPDVAYVDPTDNRKLITKSIGTTEVTLVSDDGVHKSNKPCTVNVSGVPVTGIELNTTTAEVAKDKTIKLVAKVKPENATVKDVTWSTSDSKIATVDQDGTVTGIGVGSQPAIITVTSKDPNNPVSASCAVTVKDSTILIEDIAIPTTEQLQLSETRDITAATTPSSPSYPYLSWYVSDDSILSIQPKDKNIGTISPKRAGKTKIYAVAQDGSMVTSNYCEVTVKYDEAKKVVLSETEKSLIIRGKGQLTSYVEPLSASQDVVWSTTNPHIVDVDQKGQLTAYSQGQATITCASATNPNVKAECVVTVIEEVVPVQGITLLDEKLLLQVGEAYNLPRYSLQPEYTTEREVHWHAWNDNITVKGDKIYANKVGKTELEAITMRGQTATCHVSVEVIQPERVEAICPERIDVNRTAKVITKVLPEGADQRVKFRNDTPEILDVQDDGTIKGLKPGNGWINISSVINPEIQANYQIVVNNYTSFVDDSWENVCKYANEGLDSLHKHYYFDCESNIEEFRGTLIGYEKTIKLFDREYKVRVIGENHDNIVSTTVKKAALTFETVNVVATSQWDANNNSEDYTNSTLFNFINNNKPEAQSVYNSFVESNPEIVSSLKNIKKEYVRWKDNDWDFSKYTTQLFALSHTEYFLQIDGEKPAGPVYKFYDTNDQELLQARRTKTDYKGEVTNYWTTSSRTYFKEPPHDVAWYVDAKHDAGHQAGACNAEWGISIGFCI